MAFHLKLCQGSSSISTPSLAIVIIILLLGLFLELIFDDHENYSDCVRWHLHLKQRASFITKNNKVGEFGPLAIMHLEDKLSGAERAWSARSKPHDLMQENSVNFHTPPPLETGHAVPR